MSIARQEEYFSGSGTSATATFKQTPLEGNLLVCMFGGKGVSAANLTGPGAGWTQAVKREASATSVSAGIWYKRAGAAEATAVACTQAGASAPIDIAIYEYPGIVASPTDPLDVTVSAGSSAGVISLSTGTTAATAQADELAVSLLYTNDTAPQRLAGWTQDFSEELSPRLSIPKMHGASKVLAATGTVETTPSWETANAAVAMVATFKLAAPPSTSGQRVRRLASGTYTSAQNTTTTRTTRSFTPHANRLVLLAIGRSLDTAPTDEDTTVAPSHGGLLSWTKIASERIGGASLARRVHLYRAMSATEPGAGTVTFTSPQTGHAQWYAGFEIDGVDLSGTDGSGAIVQFAVASSGVAVTTLTATLPAAPAAGNSVVALMLHGAIERHNREAGYRLIQEGQVADKGQQMDTLWLPSGDQSHTWTWATSIHAIAIIAEIKTAAAGGPAAFAGWGIPL